MPDVAMAGPGRAKEGRANFPFTDWQLLGVVHGRGQGWPSLGPCGRLDIGRPRLEGGCA
jgi:hypothetical protein